VLREQFFSTIQLAVITKHQNHHEIDKKTGKQVSFGVVRVANIAPCIELTRFLLNADWPDGVEVRVMAYHSQQILLMRSEQEKHLDQVLKRKSGSQVVFDQAVIRAHLESIESKNVIFILVATPVEEVGRDHDFDWAVVEPSSFRSFIQLAGRVLRHRTQTESLLEPNISLLQYNLKGVLLQAEERDKPVFCRPGYESEHHRLESHDLTQLLEVEKLAKRLDAELRISKKSTLRPTQDLADLEHEVIHTLLTDYTQRGPESMQGWLSSCWWLTGIPQQLVKFRRGAAQLTVFRVPDEDEWCFVEKGRYGQPYSKIEKTYSIEVDERLTRREQARFWLQRDYPQLLEGLGRSNLERAALVYGEINLPTYGKDANNLSFHYSSQFGLVAK
ncbi:MAG: type I-F CRISPR-associated helicase Cas3, partial [Gammaproteobacteria bacterium]|nr:type I-F CRISPR-associated helicase Cas3 [Gammaproteobacteria bacterium]